MWEIPLTAFFCLFIFYVSKRRDYNRRARIASVRLVRLLFDSSNALDEFYYRDIDWDDLIREGFNIKHEIDYLSRTFCLSGYIKKQIFQAPNNFNERQQIISSVNTNSTYYGLCECVVDALILLKQAKRFIKCSEDLKNLRKLVDAHLQIVKNFTEKAFWMQREWEREIRWW